MVVVENLPFVLVVIDEADEESLDAISEHGLALSTNKLFHFYTYRGQSLHTSDLLSWSIERETTKWHFCFIMFYQFVSILWGQSWWLPGISWPIAWQRVHLVSAYNEAFAVKHITCAGRHVKSRSWRSWKLHCWRFNSILAFSWKNRSRSPWMCIPKLHKVKLLVTKCLNWDIAFHIEHHFH